MKEKFKDWLIIKPCYVVMTWQGTNPLDSAKTL